MPRILKYSNVLHPRQLASGHRLSLRDRRAVACSRERGAGAAFPRSAPELRGSNEVLFFHSAGLPERNVVSIRQHRL
jgi:hypothetical protein